MGKASKETASRLPAIGHSSYRRRREPGVLLRTIQRGGTSGGGQGTTGRNIEIHPGVFEAGKIPKERMGATSVIHTRDELFTIKVIR